MSKEGIQNKAYEIGQDNLNIEEAKNEESSFPSDQENKDKSNINDSSEALEEPTREEWNNQIEFLLSTIGYAIGLGNIWRFPYLCYKNGGGTFLIPYFIMLILIALPMFFLEMVIGQYSRQGPIKAFGRLAPAFKGVGAAMLCASCYVCTYYNVITGWTLFYIIKGFTSDLPWSSCTEKSSLHCVENFTDPNITDQYAVEPCEDFFLSQMLGLDKEVYNWDNYGTFRWQMVLCLLGAWLIIGLSLIKGIKSSGKVVYFTALYPFLVLIIFFAYGLTLEGSGDGIDYYLTPDISKLGEIDVWVDATTQIFYSLGVAFGNLVTLSSYSKFKNNTQRDAILVSFINCGTSFFAGFSVFAILGYMAKTEGKDISEVVTSGSALAFITYPKAVLEMPASPLWSFLFFSMLFTLALSSLFPTVETICTAITDQFSLRHKKHFVTLGVCTTMFLGGLSMTTNGGYYMFDLFDQVCGSWNILLIALIEVVVVAWLYGGNRMIDDIIKMDIWMPKIMQIYWKLCWYFVTPILITFLLVVGFIGKKPLKYGKPDDDVPYPTGIQALSWLIPIACAMLIPFFAVYQILLRHRKGKKLGWALFQPTPKWGPPPSFLSK